ncbi:MAG: dihydrolipoamide acetyltransferase family protein [Haloarculaceae archaeon]
MTRRSFELPDVGEGLTEGEIVRWLVEPGETVSEDQPVVEVETDKAVVEVPSPVNGTVAELHAEPGDVVPVGEVIVTFETDGPGEGPEPEGSAPEPEVGTPAGGTTGSADTAGTGTGGEAETVGETGNGGESAVFAPPNVRRLARELGVDVAAVAGSGPSGRVTERDVRAAAESVAAEAEEGTSTDQAAASDPGDAATTETATVVGEPAEARRDGPTLATPRTRGVAHELGVDLDAVPAERTYDGAPLVSADAVREYAAAQEEAQAADAEAVAGVADADGIERPAADREDRVERVPYRGVRRTIGERMERSKYTAPHVTHHDSVEVSELVETRALLDDRLGDAADLTLLPLILKAVVAALAEYPYLNASLDEEREEILLKRYYNVGVATATDDGLLVPVVDDADRKGIEALAGEIDELVASARDRSIPPEDLRGGTFTVTNVGAIGGDHGTPIINYPEVAILAVGTVEERPVVVDGEVVARPVMPLSLSVDHRVVDGAVAARFTNLLKEYLNDPRRLLLE